MNYKTRIKIHNRFDIELRDARTGVIKQTGTAENIVLDRMYTRLCSLSAYFTNINFGQGTGTLSPTRTTLFSQLGSASATTHEIIRAFPVSKWTRKIVLAPEEYVGKTFTEVGISETPSNVNTHALISDSEGNPLSLHKTDIDVLTIYATVFIELVDTNDNIRFTDLPNNNTLLNYLTGGSYSNYDRDITVSKHYANTRYTDTLELLPVEKTYQSGAVTQESSVENKTITWSTRFNVGDANFDIRSIGLYKTYLVTLPEPSVFEKYTLNDVDIGIGDGETARFKIPNTAPYNLSVKIDGVNTAKYTIDTMESIHPISKLPDIDGISFRSDDVFAVTYAGRLHFYRLGPDDDDFEFISSHDVITSPTRVAFSRDDSLLAVMSSSEVGVYNVTQDCNITEVAVAQYSSGYPSGAISISYDNSYIIIATSGSVSGPGSRGNTILFKLNGNELSVVQNIATPSKSVEFSPIENVVAVTQGFTNYSSSGSAKLYRIENDQLVELISSANFDYNHGSWSYDGAYMCAFGTYYASSTSSDVLTLFERGGNGEYSIVAHKSKFLYPAANYGFFSGCFSKTAYHLLISSPSTNRVHICRIDNDDIIDTGISEAVKNITAGAGLGRVGINPVGSYRGDIDFIGTGDSESSTQFIKKQSDIKYIIFDTPPAVDEIITATYDVPHIPKSKDYVLDVSCQIQFGEGI